MRVLTLNIRHGGGSRHAGISAAICAANAEVVVLTEYRDNKTGQLLSETLRGSGWLYQASSAPAVRANGVFVASKIPFQPSSTCPACSGSAGRWQECEFATFRLIGVYFPLREDKLRFWQMCLTEAQRRTQEACLLIGDFNTGKHRIDEEGATFIGPENLDRLESHAFTDAWRHLHSAEREYTWYSNKGAGFRLDYVWASRAMTPFLKMAEYLQTTRDRAVSDHAAMMVELDWPSA